MSALAFAKWHGTGNDFVVLVDLEDEQELEARDAVALCHRRTGIGADGTIRITRASGADFFMDHRNADGSHAEMCGNGIRCLGALVYEQGLTAATELDVSTRTGLRHLSLHVEGERVVAVTVGMGPPRFERSAIPMRGPAWESFLGEPFDIGGLTLKASAISMGNPHLVLFCEEDPDRYHVEHIGPQLERDERFPERTNVEFVQVQGDVLKARVWERGVGETMACGTGACAALVAANEAGLVGRRSVVRFPGGDVTVEQTKGGEVLMTGAATHVFDGVIELHRR